MKKLACLLLVFGILFTALAGCTGSGSSSGGVTDPSASTAQSGSGTAGGGESSKDTVIVAQGTEPSVLWTLSDTITTVIANGMIVLSNIYDSLLRMEADGTISPYLATSWDVADDGMSYTFYLRDDVYFHNGEKMTAEDVAWTYNRLAEVQPASVQAMLTNFASAEVIDEATVKINMEAPFAAFLNCMTSRGAYVLSKSYFEEVGEAYNDAPIGTGAYSFVGKESDGTVTMEAFEDYWNGVAPIKNVIVKVISNTTTGFLSFENGEIDMILNASVSDCLNIQDGGDITWDYTSSSGVTKLDFMCFDSKVTSDVNLRRAIQSAINKDDVLLGAMEGYGEVAQIFLNPNFSGVPDIADVETVPYDLEQAKAYLEASDYDGTAVKCLVTAGTKAASAAAIIQGQLLAIGINMEIVAVDATTNRAMLLDGENSDFDMYLGSSTASLYDAQVISSNYRSNFIVAGRPDQAQMDELIIEQAKIINTDEREAMVGEFLNILTEQAYCVPLYYEVYALAYNKGLAGVTPHPLQISNIYSWSWN